MFDVRWPKDDNSPFRNELWLSEVRRIPHTDTLHLSLTVRFAVCHYLQVSGLRTQILLLLDLSSEFNVSVTLTDPSFRSTYAHGPHPDTDGQMADVLLTCGGGGGVGALQKTFIIGEANGWQQLVRHMTNSGEKVCVAAASDTYRYIFKIFGRSKRGSCAKPMPTNKNTIKRT